MLGVQESKKVWVVDDFIQLVDSEGNALLSCESFTLDEFDYIADCGGGA